MRSSNTERVTADPEYFVAFFSPSWKKAMWDLD
jgi:hypothetical protein